MENGIINVSIILLTINIIDKYNNTLEYSLINKENLNSFLRKIKLNIFNEKLFA